MRLWFQAMWYVTNQKHGVSALGLQRILGLGSYQTAWTWLHKLRRAMVRPGRDLLEGDVEVDETLTLEDMSSVRTVARKLDKLNIEHPPIDEKGSIWYTYVKRIFGEVNAGAIGDARVVWRGMKESMNDGR